MKLSQLSPPLQDDGTVHPSIARDYQPSLDWLQGRMNLEQMIKHDFNPRDIIERLFNLVPVPSMSAERLLEEDGQRMMEVLVEAMKDAFFLKYIQRVSVNDIASDHPDGIMSKIKKVNIGGVFRDVPRVPPSLDWLNALIAMDKQIALRYLGGLKIDGMGDYVRRYFQPLNDHPTLMEGIESQRALKFYKIFGWDRCKQSLDEHDVSQALEMDLGL